MWKNWKWNLWVVRQEPAGTWWSSYIFNNVATRCVDIVFYSEQNFVFIRIRGNTRITNPKTYIEISLDKQILEIYSPFYTLREAKNPLFWI